MNTFLMRTSAFMDGQREEILSKKNLNWIEMKRISRIRRPKRSTVYTSGDSNRDSTSNGVKKPSTEYTL